MTISCVRDSRDASAICAGVAGVVFAMGSPGLLLSSVSSTSSRLVSWSRGMMTGASGAVCGRFSVKGDGVDQIIVSEASQPVSALI